MSWRDTWRETVESFLREVRDPEDPARIPGASDPVMEALARARGEVLGLERELAATDARRVAEAESAAACERRRMQAERIGDAETARIAEAFRTRHATRADVLTRKHAVLEEELTLAQAELNDLLDYARVDPKPATRPDR